MSGISDRPNNIAATQTKFLIDLWNGALHFVNTPYISVFLYRVLAIAPTIQFNSQA